jgi:hypothetical protein
MPRGGALDVTVVAYEPARRPPRGRGGTKRRDPNPPAPRRAPVVHRTWARPSCGPRFKSLWPIQRTRLDAGPLDGFSNSKRPWATSGGPAIGQLVGERARVPTLFYICHHYVRLGTNFSITVRKDFTTVKDLLLGNLQFYKEEVSPVLL